MTNTDDNQKTRRRARLAQLLASPWPVLFSGLVISNLVNTHDGIYGFLLPAALALAVLAVYALHYRLNGENRSRSSAEPVTSVPHPEKATRVEAAGSGKWLGVNVWSILIPSVIVWATLFARDLGWLGSNAPQRTNWIVILGLVFIAGICRLWWRNRKSRPVDTDSHRESGK